MGNETTLTDETQLLECNLDDMTAEALAYAMDRLLSAGALDVWFTPIYMKKNRPATMLSVLCRPADGPALRWLLLRETTTLGVRWRSLAREIADRRVDEVMTPWGAVRRKLKLLNGQVVSAKPEYDDCARLAREHGLSLEQVVEAARQAEPSTGTGGTGNDK
jgi:pyridinium-3,5-bisthiocarboxylic acid mononucleotide nickel chelatase